MKYYIIAGEASGDLHGSNLIKGLKKEDPNCQVRCWGGDLMKAEGAELAKHYKEGAIMGFWEVLINLKKITRNIKECKKDILNYNPDILILIDYPGFNLRIAKFAKENNIKTFYYIAPKVWAWKEKRIHKLKAYIDRLFIIFPFEIEYFKKWGIDAIYNGNPLVECIDNYQHKNETRHEFCNRVNINPDKPSIALLAGSRKMEIKFLLPRMAQVIKNFPNYQFILAAAPSIDINLYNSILQDSAKNVKILHGETYSILRHSRAAIISSGTASLEAALIKTPQIVCYGASELSFQIAIRLMKVKYISLANLILDKEIFKELLQHDCSPQRITQELNMLLNDKECRDKMDQDYNNLREILGTGENSTKIAKSMIDELVKIKNEK